MQRISLKRKSIRFNSYYSRVRENGGWRTIIPIKYLCADRILVQEKKSEKQYEMLVDNFHKYYPTQLPSNPTQEL